MAKILVADDNSNIQKMVGLALKDQGIDVVAVGNGEAAVRKISDVRPDLVLADVFMPVRNGYEVCQFVKADSALSHIPVILLVGAFDPLDEQEAQRVGADGVLKKPFVPPDPLISMVKSALQRAGVATSGGGQGKAAEPEALRAADLLSPSRATAPTVPTLESFPIPTASHEEPILALENESFVDELPERPQPVRIDAEAQPVAFGSLLETPAAETEEDQELGYVAPVNSELAIEHNWHDADGEESEEVEEEEKPVAPWRRDEAESNTGSKPAGESRANDWRAGSFEQIRARKTPLDSWETVDEKPELVETAPASKASAKEAPAATASRLEDTTVISATPFAKNAWASTISQASQELASKEPATALQEVAPTRQEKPAAPETAVTSAPEVQETNKKDGKEPKDAWFSVTSSPWDAEIQKANRLAATWDAAAVQVPAAPEASNGNEKAAETAKAVIEEAVLPAAAVEAIREEAAQVAEHVTQRPKPIAEKASPAAPQSAAETAAPSMDELVAKVLAKISPDVLQAVTREILKPVVEAIVKEEMKSKKS